MKVILFLLTSALLVSCKTTDQTSEPGQKRQSIHIPKWSFMVQAASRYSENHRNLPARAYVFPAIRLDANGQAIDQLQPVNDAQGALSWSSSAPHGFELKRLLESKLRERKFKIVTFDDLLNAPTEHSIVVFNPYYSEGRQSISQNDPGNRARWTNFARITAASFPLSLDPAAKQDIANLEAATLFERERNSLSVTKETLSYLLEHLGENRQWSEMRPLVY